MEDLLLKVLAYGDSVFFWVLAAVGALIARQILATISSETAKKYVSRALAEVGDAVTDVSRTYVEALKAAAADGKLTANERAEAKAKALAMAKQNMGAEGLKRLGRILGLDLGALDAWLGTKIEASLASNMAEGVKPAPLA